MFQWRKINNANGPGILQTQLSADSSHSSDQNKTVRSGSNNYQREILFLIYSYRSIFFGDVHVHSIEMGSAPVVIHTARWLYRTNTHVVDRRDEVMEP